jgi:hypothetical protein
MTGLRSRRPSRGWWGSTDDPTIRLLTMRRNRQNSGQPVAGHARMIAEAVTGTKPKVGDNRKLSI